jgi:hypothetical protein
MAAPRVPEVVVNTRATHTQTDMPKTCLAFVVLYIKYGQPTVSTTLSHLLLCLPLGGSSGCLDREPTPHFTPEASCGSRRAMPGTPLAKACDWPVPTPSHSQRDPRTGEPCLAGPPLGPRVSPFLDTGLLRSAVFSPIPIRRESAPVIRAPLLPCLLWWAWCGVVWCAAPTAAH